MEQDQLSVSTNKAEIYLLLFIDLEEKFGPVIS